MRGQHKQRGFLLMVAVFIIVAAAVIATAIAFMVVAGTGASVSHVQSAQALFIAESGFERASRILISPVLTDRVACTSITGNGNLTNVSFGQGVFTVTETNSNVAYYNGGSFATPNVSTLNAALTASTSATTILVNSLNSYSTSGGRIMIDREVIDYSYTSTTDADCGGAGTAPCLLGAQRGRDGTTAASHVSGTRVGQYQCALQSQGGVASLSNANGMRTLRQAVQLQEAWAVGKSGGGSLPTTENLNDVKCIISNDCWAVGDNGVILHYTGTWSSVTSPTTEKLFAVDCVSASRCHAVGDNGIALVYVSGSWATQVSGTTKKLFDVTCTAGGDCWTVGEKDAGVRYTTSGSAGANWTLVTTVKNDMYGIDAIDKAPNDIGWAVGKQAQSHADREAAPPGDWPDTKKIRNQQDLFAMECLEISGTPYCWTGGKKTKGIWRWDYNNAQKWDGSTTAWAEEFNGNGEHVRSISIVAVGTDFKGWAVGDKGVAYQFTGLQTPTSRLDTWVLYAGATTTENLNGVSCVTSTDCWAVGDKGTLLHWDGSSWSGIGGGNASALRWNNNSWSDASIMLPGSAQELQSISMLSYADGWAVGKRDGNNFTIARWTGSAWISQSYADATNREDLNGVSCVDASNCWAVGKRVGNNFTIVRWNGTTWAATPLIDATNREELNSIYCVDASNCWAVGKRVGDNFTIVRWDGSAWSATPLTDATNVEDLNSVYCTDTSNCWAVGKRVGDNFTIVRWDGANWSATPLADATNREELKSVYCGKDINNSTFCWAVGKRRNDNFTFVRWDGTAWSATPLLDATNREELRAIACTTAKDCWAVGKRLNDNFTFVHWDGSNWSAQPLTDASNREDLNAIGMLGHRQSPQAAWREQFQ